MSTPVAGSLSVTPLYASAADVLVLWDDVNATWRSLPSVSAPMTVGQGGTGQTTLALNRPLIGNGTSPVLSSTIVTDNGTTLQVSTNVVIGNPVTSPPATSLVINKTASTPQALPANTQLALVNENAPGTLTMDAYNAGNNIMLRRSRGTAAAPAVVQASDYLGAINGVGRAATGYSGTVAQLAFSASENWSDTAQGTQVIVQTTTPATTVLVSRMNVRQGVIIGNPAPDPGQGGLTLNGNAASPQASTDNPQFWVSGADTSSPIMMLDAYGGGAVAAGIIGRHSDGTATTPTAVQAGNTLLNIIGEGRGASTYAPGAIVFMQAAENFSETARGTAFVVSTAALGAATQTRRVYIQAGMLMYDAGGGIPAGVDMGAGTINLPSAGGYYLNGQNITAGHLPGTQTNDNALAGQVGEVISALNTAGVAMAIGVTVDIATINLTAGDWDIQGECWVNVAGAQLIAAGINTVSATLPSTPAMNTARSEVWDTGGQANAVLPLAPCRMSLGGTTTVFLSALCNTAAGTGTGKIWARRAR